MESIIIDINKDIEELDNKLENHKKNLDSLRLGYVKDVENQTIKLNDLISKSAIEYKKLEELNSKISKLKIESSTLSKRIEHYRIQSASIKDDRELIDSLREEITKLNLDKKDANTEIEIARVNHSQITLKSVNISEDIITLNNEIIKLQDSKAKLTNDNNDILSKHRLTETKLNSLLITKTSLESKIKEDSSDLEAVDIKITEANDKVELSKGKLSEVDDKIIIGKSEIAMINTKIGELNEIKDNITHEIENERKKLRNEENRILAIKKEVLMFILEHKDTGNKKQISEFAKRLNNGT